MVQVPKDGVEKDAIDKLEKAYADDIRKDVFL
jgi:hypothetical protein